MKSLLNFIGSPFVYRSPKPYEVKEVVSDYEFVKVDEHKSHLLMNVKDIDALCTEFSSYGEKSESLSILHFKNLRLMFCLIIFLSAFLAD